MKELLDDIDRCGTTTSAWRWPASSTSRARVPAIRARRWPSTSSARSSAGVSGGCVEGAVVTEALSILQGEREAGVITFGYSDDEAFAVGLTCGGTIRLFIEELDW